MSTFKPFTMTPKHPLQWFLERVGKTVTRRYLLGKSEPETTIRISNRRHAKAVAAWQDHGFEFCVRDPHPLTASILTCNVLRCDECGKIGTKEDLDKEIAAAGFEGDGWKRLSNGTINCGCK